MTGFIPPLSTLRNSSERLISVRAGTGTDMNILVYPFYLRNITRAGGPQTVPFDQDNSAIVRTIYIGCKGEGLPKSSISWYQAPVPDVFGRGNLDNSNRVFINDTLRDDVLITVPRQGRSVLRLELDPTDETCRRYICEATNAAGNAVGGVDICTQCTYMRYIVVIG